jgi:hypothetical protein
MKTNKKTQERIKGKEKGKGRRKKIKRIRKKP